MKLSPQQRAMLKTVEMGRVKYGSIYPRNDRDSYKRAIEGGKLFAPLHGFLIDGHEAYGGEKSTLASLESRELIHSRMKDVAMVTVPSRTVRHGTLIQGVVERVLPERQEPEDAGWRVAVELTDAGKQALRA